MEQKALSNISIGRRGDLVVRGAVITQKSPLYDRLGNPGYLNPRALSGAELMNARFGQGASEKFANAIINAAIKIRAERPKAASGTDLNKKIVKSISNELGAGSDAKDILGSHNSIILALFDVYTILSMEPELSVGQKYDLALKVGETLFYYPDEKSKYSGNERDELLIATTPAQACGAVHLVLGKEAERLAQDRKQAGDTMAWKSEIKEAIGHYKDAIAFDIENEEARYLLSGIYARRGQHGKAADIYREAFERAPQKGAKAHYSSFLAENAIYTKDIKRMIGALRAIEREFPAGEALEGPEYPQAKEAAEDLRAALAKILSA